MTFTVTNANDSGTGSLRQVITDANAGVPNIIAVIIQAYLSAFLLVIKTSLKKLFKPKTNCEVIIKKKIYAEGRNIVSVNFQFVYFL